MSKTSTIAVCVAAVLIVASIMGAIAYNVQQGTVKRKDCAENGGSWTVNNQCLRFVQIEGDA